jgi:hypothetical protein
MRGWCNHCSYPCVRLGLQLPLYAFGFAAVLHTIKHPAAGSSCAATRNVMRVMQAAAVARGRADSSTDYRRDALRPQLA